MLRLKNYLLADTNKLVLMRVFHLLREATNVQALYAQSFDVSMDDEALACLTETLKANKSIWALNVGENIRVSRAGWTAFAAALPETHVTHLYAGSESTVHGALKVQMRDHIRVNRAKHDLHVSLANVHVIRQVGQMWWNPRNAAAVRSACAQLDELRRGQRIAFKAEGGRWRVARVVCRCVKASASPRRVLVATDDGETAWVDLDDSRLSAATAHRVVVAHVAKRGWWPASVFDEVGVVALYDARGETGAWPWREWGAVAPALKAQRAVRMAEFDLALAL